MLPWRRVLRLPSNLAPIRKALLEMGLDGVPLSEDEDESVESHSVKLEINANSTYSVWVDGQAMIWLGDMARDFLDEIAENC